MNRELQPGKPGQIPRTMGRKGEGMSTDGGNVAQSEGLFVVGEGKVTALPDRIVLTLAIESRGVNATQAHDEMTQRTQHLIRVLMEQGIAHSDMQTAWVAAHPVLTPMGMTPTGPVSMSAPQAGAPQMGQTPVAAGYPSPMPPHLGAAPFSGALFGYPGPGVAQTAGPQLSPQARGYAAGSWLRVIVREPQRLGELLDTATAAGVVFGAGMSAGTENEAALRCAALQAAAKDAWAKAEVLALAAGRRLGQLLTLNEELLPSGVQPAVGAMSALTELSFCARVYAGFAWS